MNEKASQSGIALLQVLLISLVVSLMAIQFSRTAVNQVEMAKSFEQRVQSQLVAHSAFSEVIFSQLSDTTSAGESENLVILQSLSDELNRYGEFVQWNEYVRLRVQDLNGLLPQLYTEHSLWRVVLNNYDLDSDDIESYLGRWKDFQDPDINSWRGGEVERDFLPSGQRYLDGYAQTNHVLRWVFSDDIELTDFLLSISDLNAPFDTNILNAPRPLLEGLFDPDVSNFIHRNRTEASQEIPKFDYFLPQWVKRENIYVHNSPYQKIEVVVDSGGGAWQQSWVVLLDLDRPPHYQIVRN